MKRIVEVLMLSCIVCLTVQLALATTISVEPAYQEVAPGDEFTVNITVDPESEAIRGVDFLFRFDTAVLRGISIQAGDFFANFSAPVISQIINNITGTIDYGQYIEGSEDDGATEPGTVAQITFEANDAGMSMLDFETVNLINLTDKIEPITKNNGSVKSEFPSQPFLIDGYVFYENQSECLDPTVTITNTDTGEVWQAETAPGYHYYQLTLMVPDNVKAGDVVRFNVASPDGSKSNITFHEVSMEDITNGGLFNINLTLESEAQPDLVITDLWVCWPDNCTICYTVKNAGIGNAPAGHSTTILVDGVERANDAVPIALGPQTSYTGCFDSYAWGYTQPSDSIVVCADNNEEISESDEGNNCRTEHWKCGDVNEDGFVDTTDVLAVWDYYTTGKALTNKWAADTALNNGVIDTNDVIAIWNNFVFGSALQCLCSD